MILIWPSNSIGNVLTISVCVCVWVIVLVILASTAGGCAGFAVVAMTGIGSGQCTGKMRCFPGHNNS